MEKEKFYISTAIAYTSAKPHIGNTYEVVLADAIARYKRLLGYDVYFQTGTDEHGLKIEQKAKDENITPQKFVDNVSEEIKQIWDLMGTSYDKFVRTTDKEHEKKVQQIFQKLYEQGDIYLGKYEGWYCIPCESFFTDSQLVNGKCPDCGREVKKESEEAYFFKLSKYQERLIEYIKTHPSFIEPEARKNEMMKNFLEVGLQDLCVSRTTFDWGIKVPFNEKHIIYVWLDALSNYITFLGYDVDGNHSNEFKKYWPADIHLIGKDILRFHTLYWPIMLMALNIELPKQIFGHPWLLMGDGKMSKSKGNVMYADDLVNLFGLDATRYYLLHEIPFASDGVITYDLIIERINSDLANILGNLVNRTISMINKYFDGIIPNHNVEEAIDKDLINQALKTAKLVDTQMKDLKVAAALDEIFELFRRCNKYIDETTPWVLAKQEQDKDRLGTVLYNLLEAIRIGAVLLSAFLPTTVQKIFTQLNTDETSYESINEFGKLISGDKIGTAEVLFARIKKEDKLKEIEEHLHK